MTVSKQVWTPLPLLLHHLLSVTSPNLFLHLDSGDGICIPNSSCQGCVSCPAPRLCSVGQCRWGNSHSKAKGWSRNPGSNLEQFMCCASGKHWLMKWPRPWICWGRLFVADTLCIWALIVCSNQKVPDTSVIIYIYYIINARKARTCSILSIWNRVGRGGNDASIPNFQPCPLE